MTDLLTALLLKHEALRLKPYYDTQGKLTIGVGRNLTDNGISEEEAYALLKSDIQAVYQDVAKFSWFHNLDEVRQAVVASMVFNLGLPRFSLFHRMIAALSVRDYAGAASEMRASDWFRQVGTRAVELTDLMQTGGQAYEKQA